MPTLVFDCSVLENRPWTGVERYAFALLRGLPVHLPQWRLVAAWREPNEIVRDLPGWEHQETAANRSRFLWRRFTLPKIAAKESADILVSPVAHVPELEGVVSCRTIHDIPVEGATFGEPMNFSQRVKLIRELKRDLPTIFPSQATHDAFAAQVEGQIAPTCVAHHGVDDRFLSEPLLKPQPQIRIKRILVVGTVRPRRMPQVVAEAARTLDLANSEIEVRWLGRVDMNVSKFPQIKFLGPLEDAGALQEFVDADLLLCPSVLEGFGLPLLEGLALGMPVLTAEHPASREVGVEHVYYYDGRSHQALSDAIQSLNHSLGDFSPEECRAFAANFSWEKSCADHASFYASLL